MARLVGKNFTITPKITTFTANGTFAADPASTECHLLVIAGGGGASAAGGGAGGFREFPAHPIPASPVAVTVGAGGAGSSDAEGAGTAGSDSVFGSATPITSSGGGRGGGIGLGSGLSEGGTGGSGGGSGGNTPSLTTVNPGNSGSYDPPEGNTGGGGRYNGTSYYANGGGGGAGGVGGDEVPDGLGNDHNAISGSGGLAKMSTVSGSKVWYSGGGGGSYKFTWKLMQSNPDVLDSYGPRGGKVLGGGSIFPAQKGGGGNASEVGSPDPNLGTGVANTGGGGGGVGTTQYNPNSPASPGAGAAGGSGVVIVSEPNVNAGGVWDYKQVFQKKVIGEWR